jgi:hypothetical protein
VKRNEFEHVIAAAANIIREDEFVVIGSQAVLGSTLAVPASMLVSMEADIYPARNPERAIEVDGALGDGSPFHRQYGYYAHGVGPETAKAPVGWQERLVRVDVPPRKSSAQQPVALCLEIHDLVLSKLVAGRDRDIDYAQQARAGGLLDLETMRGRLAGLPVGAEHRDRVAALVDAIASVLVED